MSRWTWQDRALAVLIVAAIFVPVLVAAWTEHGR